jgi:hypothetical protein
MNEQNAAAVEPLQECERCRNLCAPGMACVSSDLGHVNADRPCRDEAHIFGRETSGQSTRAVCSCGNWHGQWRHPIDRRGLHSDEGEHIYAVRREQAQARGGDS